MLFYNKEKPGRNFLFNSFIANVAKWSPCQCQCQQSTTHLYDVHNKFVLAGFRIREHGKKTMIITNSDYMYTNVSEKWKIILTRPNNINVEFPLTLPKKLGSVGR